MPAATDNELIATATPAGAHPHASLPSVLISAAWAVIRRPLRRQGPRGATANAEAARQQADAQLDAVTRRVDQIMPPAGHRQRVAS